MTLFAYDLAPRTKPDLGLILLQSDETLEQDARRLLPPSVNLHTTRVPSGLEVSADSLREMRHHLPTAAGLLPRSVAYASIGYGCTSGTSQIGAARIADLVRQGAPTPHVTEPVSALIAACARLGINRLGFLSPYVADVSETLRAALSDRSIASPVFGTFAEPEEARVAHISATSTRAAARQLAAAGGIDALFLSCTNLPTLDVILPLEAETGLTVLSSNLVLLWHMLQHADAPAAPDAPGRLWNAR